MYMYQLYIRKKVGENMFAGFDPIFDVPSLSMIIFVTILAYDILYSLQVLFWNQLSLLHGKK